MLRQKILSVRGIPGIHDQLSKTCKPHLIGKQGRKKRRPAGRRLLRWKPSLLYLQAERRRRTAAKPAKPKPIRASDAGSGTPLPGSGIDAPKPSR